jgi:hypothetical protein
MFHFVSKGKGGLRTMPSRSLQKQVSIFLPLEDWKRVRLEAARRNVPITELCRRWMSSGLQELRRRPSEPGFSSPFERAG